MEKSDREALVRVLRSVADGTADLFESLSRRSSAMTVEEVAALFHVSERHIYKLVQDGILPHFKVGKAVRFDPGKIADWLEGASEGDAAKLNEPGRRPRD